jgi:hypothetical protein
MYFNCSHRIQFLLFYKWIFKKQVGDMCYHSRRGTYYEYKTAKDAAAKAALQAKK